MSILGRLAASAAGMFCALAMTPGQEASAAEITLKLHQFLPAQANVPKQILYVWADKVEKASGGRIKIQRFPSMQLGGKPPALYSQVVDGIADIIWTVPGYTPGRFPHSEVFELPFMMTNAEATSRAYWDIYNKYMKNADYKDVHVLGVWVHGPGLIHSKKPIKTIADLNGVKLRAPTRVTNLLFKSLGATPIGMPVPAVPQALSKGVIDATVIPWEVTGALKISELVTNHTTFGDASLYTTTFVFAMNKAAYAKLPADLKKAVDDNSGAQFSAWAGKTMQAADAPSHAAAKKRGNTIITLDPNEVARWKKASKAVEGQWFKDMKAKGVDGEALLAEARALIKKYTK